MGLHSLVVSRDSDAVFVLRTLMQQLNIESEVCTELDRAVERLAQGGIAAVAVDYDVEHAAELLKAVRQNYAGTCVALAIVKGLPSIEAAYDMGANFVLIKPIRPEPAARSLREAMRLMEGMAGRPARLVVPSVAYAHLEGSRDPAIILDISEGGMAVQALQSMQANGPVKVHFDLPGSLDTLAVTCDVVWADSTGRAGLRFTDISRDARRHVQQWVRANTSHMLRPARMAEEHAVVPPPDAVPPGNLRRAGASAAQRIFAALVDGIILLLASGLFVVTFWLDERHLPSSCWTLPVSLGVPFVLWVLYLYLFLIHPRGTPGMQLAERMTRRVQPPEMFAYAPQPRLASVGSRLLGWLESRYRVRPKPDPVATMRDTNALAAEKPSVMASRPRA
mgnify:CR=1 FL=1